MKALKNILNCVLFIFAHSGELMDEAVSTNLCNLEGQGRDRYGI